MAKSGEQRPQEPGEPADRGEGQTPDSLNELVRLAEQGPGRFVDAVVPAWRRRTRGG